MSEKHRPSLSQTQALYEQHPNSRERYAQEVSAYAARQRDKAKRRNAAVQYNGPTPERARKAPEGVDARVEIPGQGPVPPVKSHRITSPVERYGPYLNPDLEHTARRLLALFLLAERGPRVTASYTGVGGNVAGPRSGGVSDRARLATAIVTVIKSEFPIQFVRAIEIFVLQVIVHQDGSPIKFEEAGRELGIPWKSEDAAKGAGYARFIDALILAEKFLSRQDALGWLDPPSAHAARDLLSELKARMQVRREMEAKRRRQIGGPDDP